MNKEKILELSKEENKLVNEKEREISNRSSSFAIIIVLISWIFVFTVSRVKGLTPHAANIILLSLIFSSGLYQMFNRPLKAKKFDIAKIIVLLSSLILLIASVIEFLGV